MEILLNDYITQMEEIKRRMAAIKKISEIFSPNEIATECIYLQFRKVLELIAMSSLVANSQAMELMNNSRRKLGKQWNGDTILKRVEEINPDFYPVPIIEAPSEHPDVKVQLIEKPGGFLGRDEFAQFYNRCGKLMHADNPLGEKADYQALWKEGPTWESKIMELLACHKIRLVGQEGFYLVHMHEERDGKAHMYEFGRLTGHPPTYSGLQTRVDSG